MENLPGSRDTALIVDNDGDRAGVACSYVRLTVGTEAQTVSSHAELTVLLSERPERFYVAVVSTDLYDAPGGEAVDLALGYNIPVVAVSEALDETQRNALSSGT